MITPRKYLLNVEGAGKWISLLGSAQVAPACSALPRPAHFCLHCPVPHLLTVSSTRASLHEVKALFCLAPVIQCGFLEAVCSECTTSLFFADGLHKMLSSTMLVFYFPPLLSLLNLWTFSANSGAKKAHVPAMCCSPCSLAPGHLAATCQIPQLAFVMLGSFSSFLREERQVQCGLAFTVLSLPFQTIYSCCCDSVQRETAQSCVPCPPRGSRSFGGCLGSRGAHFTEQANGQRVVGRCSCQRETALPTCFLHWGPCK